MSAYYDKAKWLNVTSHDYMCAVNANLPVEITSYAQALDWWKRRDGLWTGTDRPVGKPNDYSRRMRMGPDGSIEFEYDKHVLATWHPDKTLTVEPYPNNKWGAFERHVMPKSISVGAGVRSGKVIFLAPHEAGRHQWRVNLETDTGAKNVVDPDVTVIRGDRPITLQRVGQYKWEPVSELRCKPFYWFELDKGRLREASKKYNLPEFIAAISTAIQMGADIETSKAYDSNVARRKTSGGEDILTLLEQERFVEAAALVRPAEDRQYDATQGKWVYEKKGLNSTDIKKIRHTAYIEMGLIYLESERVVTLPQFNNIERKLADFGVPEE